MDVFDRSNRPELLGGKNPALRVPTLELDDGRAPRRVERDPLVPRRRERLRDEGLNAHAPSSGCSSSSTRSSRPSSSRGSGTCCSASGRSTRPSSRRSGAAARPRTRRAGRELDGRDWLVGDAFTIADISLYGDTHVAEEGAFDLGRYANVRAWIERVASVPGYIPSRPSDQSSDGRRCQRDARDHGTRRRSYARAPADRLARQRATDRARSRALRPRRRQRGVRGRAGERCGYGCRRRAGCSPRLRHRRRRRDGERADDSVRFDARECARDGDQHDQQRRELEAEPHDRAEHATERRVSGRNPCTSLRRARARRPRRRRHRSRESRR